MKRAWLALHHFQTHESAGSDLINIYELRSLLSKAQFFPSVDGSPTYNSFRAYKPASYRRIVMKETMHHKEIK